MQTPDHNGTDDSTDDERIADFLRQLEAKYGGRGHFTSAIGSCPMQGDKPAPWRDEAMLDAALDATDGDIAEVADSFNTSYATIRNWIYRHDGIDADEYIGRESPSKDRLLWALRNHHSLSGIAAYFGVSPSKLRGWMDDYDISRQDHLGMHNPDYDDPGYDLPDDHDFGDFPDDPEDNHD